MKRFLIGAVAALSMWSLAADLPAQVTKISPPRHHPGES